MNSVLDAYLPEAGFPSLAASQCPWPLYRAFRDEAPVHQLPTGEFLVSRFDAAVSIFRDSEGFSTKSHVRTAEGGARLATLEDLGNHTFRGIESSDPPEHTVRRKTAFELFRPGHVRTLEPMMRADADHLIDAFMDRGELEFRSEFASVFPLMVVLRLFGLPVEGAVEHARSWAGIEGKMVRFADSETQRRSAASVTDAAAWIGARVAERLEHPRDDELSRYVRLYLEAQGIPGREHMTTEDLANLNADVMELFIGGFFAPAAHIITTMLLLLQHPKEQEEARSSRRLLKQAIEESLRIESPLQLVQRLVLSDIVIAGHVIPAGSTVILNLGSANRDERAFASPDEFDLDRPAGAMHLAFGTGIHFCIGAPLTRMETAIAFERIFERMTNLRLIEEESDLGNMMLNVRAPRTLRIAFDPVR